METERVQPLAPPTAEKHAVLDHIVVVDDARPTKKQKKELILRDMPHRVKPFKLPHRIATIFYGAGIKPCPAVEMIHDNPRLFKIKNFLGKGQLAYFDSIRQKQRGKFQHSFTEDDNGTEVISEERTSSYKSFLKQENKAISTVEKKAADFVGISVDNVEPLQMVMYSEGQRFGEHHDAGTLAEGDIIELVYPRRLVTFFVYLNDLPKDEGCTEFPRLSISVQPERGTALFFCNVNEDGSCSVNMVHKANPVSRDLMKFGLNIWLME